MVLGHPLEIKFHSRMDMDISPNIKDNGTLQSNLQNSTIPRTHNFVNNNIVVENPIKAHENLPNGREDLRLDIMECASTVDDHQLAKTLCIDESESSSSFDGSTCDSVNGSGLDDQEAESRLCEDYPLPSALDAPSGLFWMRKKKLSDEWRKFVRPVMWRCKWIELKVKELQYRAQKYDEELDEYNLTKHSQLEKLELEGFNAKTQPPLCPARRTKIMKRKKRKRAEETTDITSYMSQHNLFSYTENRKPITVDANYCRLADYSADDKTKNFKDEIDFSNGCPYPNSVEHHDKIMSEILLKIEKAISQTRKMKQRIEKVMNDHSEKFSTDHNPVSVGTDNETHVLSGYAPSGDIEDIFMPQDVVPSHGEGTPLLGMMVQSEEQPLIRAISGAVKEETEMSGEVTREELNYFEKVINEVTMKPPQVSPEEKPDVNSPVTRPSRVQTRKRKKQVSRIPSTSARRRSAAARKRRTSG